MTFRGWFTIDGQEFANSSRLLAHLAPVVPTNDTDIAPVMDCACDIRIPYDDTWPDLPAELNHELPYRLDEAPWYNAAVPESAEFAGVWVMEVDGLDTVPIERQISEAVCFGGVAGPSRDASRTVTFSALLVACSNAGARYGLTWLACLLRNATRGGGADLQFFKAHPSGSAADPASLLRTATGVVLTSSPKIVELAGKGGGARHRQASMFRVEWEMVCTNPYLYGQQNMQTVVWDEISEESITWAHAPDCTDTGSCDLPTVYNAECVPPTVELRAADIPVCGGCLPLCSIERRVWTLQAATVSACEEAVVNIRVTNNGEDPLTVNFYWRPCGDEDQCSRVYPMSVSGLPGGMTVVADSITGRPYIDQQGTRQRQVGIVGTPDGAPWRPTLLDTMMCWELVAEAAPGADYSVVIDVRERDA
ncbi:sugar transferase [Rhodococcus sp. Z13]|uniref:Sugar transferase n=1 Tax=Rhodococcus sacchari TaxID=2962047 RepID=A0ACD4DCC4_9NOCA|nr:sugar transferase [Rhodococcus sp. Z13]UYP17708.1 sugar transferase [Rhodococcus sp. Z13]